VNDIGTRLTLFSELKDFEGAFAVLFAFAEVTRLNGETRNLLLLFRKSFSMSFIMELLKFNKDLFFVPCCQIVRNLMRCCFGFVLKAIELEYWIPFVRNYHADMDIRSKLATAEIVCRCWLQNVGEMKEILEVRRIFADLEDLMEVGDEIEAPIFAACLTDLEDSELME
jgi:hypothetical protein